MQSRIVPLTVNKYINRYGDTISLGVRPAFSQASCRRLPAFYFDYRLTGIGDNIAGNYVKKYKQTNYLYIFWQEVIDVLLDPRCIPQNGYSRVGFYQQFQLRCTTARKHQLASFILKVSPKFQLSKQRFK